MATKSNANAFDFRTLDADEAKEIRSQKGTRRSKYSPIGDAFTDLADGAVLAFEASKNEVQGVRNYMRRNFEGEHKVNSRHIGDDKYEVHISHDN